MLRELMTHGGNVADATFVAEQKMTTGYAVQKDYANKKAVLPTAETASDLFFVQKSRFPTGINAARKEFSDYDADFINVAEGEKVILVGYGEGETFAVDAFDSTIKAGAEDKYVAANTDGKLTVADAAVASKYKFVGMMSDNGHALAKIMVCDTVGKNA